MPDEQKINKIFNRIDQFMIDLFNEENPTFIEIDHVFARFQDKFLKEKLVAYIDWYLKKLEDDKLNHFVLNTKKATEKKVCPEDCYK